MDIVTEENQSRPSGIGGREAEKGQGSLMDIITEKCQSGPSRWGARKRKKFRGVTVLAFL
jgi:hypothetical protein